MSSAPLSRIPPGHTSFTWFGAAAGTEQAQSAGTAAAGATLSSASQEELRIVTSRLPASHTASTWFTGRLRQLRKELEERISAAVAATSTVRTNYALESDIPEGVARVKASLESSQANGAVLWSVDSSYYTWSLSERASLLGCSTSALCKAILMENKGATDSPDAASGGAAPSAGGKAGKGPKSSKGGPASGAGAATGESSAASGPDYGARFMLVVVQYEAKIDDARLAKQLRAAAEQAAARGDAGAAAALRGPLGPGCNFQVAKEPDNDRLTGFPHNAVSPVATSSPLQVVLPLALVEGLPARTGERSCWLGGGHVDTKLRLPLSELARTGGGGGLLGGEGAPPPLVLDYTEPLGGEDDE